MIIINSFENYLQIRFYVVLIPFYKEYRENNVHKINNPDYSTVVYIHLPNFIFLK